MDAHLPAHLLPLVDAVRAGRTPFLPVHPFLGRNRRHPVVFPAPPAAEVGDHHLLGHVRIPFIRRVEGYDVPGGVQVRVLAAVRVRVHSHLPRSSPVSVGTIRIKPLVHGHSLLARRHCSARGPITNLCVALDPDTSDALPCPNAL